MTLFPSVCKCIPSVCQSTLEQHYALLVGEPYCLIASLLCPCGCDVASSPPRSRGDWTTPHRRGIKPSRYDSSTIISLLSIKPTPSFDYPQPLSPWRRRSPPHKCLLLSRQPNDERTRSGPMVTTVPCLTISLMPRLAVRQLRMGSSHVSTLV